MTKTIRVNFNHVDNDGLTIASQKYASNRLYIGDMVLAIERPYACLASVVAIDHDGIVRLQLDPAHLAERIPA